MGPDAMILVFLMLSFKPAFSLSSFIPYTTTTGAHALEPVLHNKGSHCSEKPMHHSEE